MQDFTGACMTAMNPRNLSIVKEANSIFSMHYPASSLLATTPSCHTCYILRGSKALYLPHAQYAIVVFLVDIGCRIQNKYILKQRAIPAIFGRPCWSSCALASGPGSVESLPDLVEVIMTFSDNQK